MLPERHSPINTSSGRGNQGVYLAGLSEALGQLLLKLIEEHADAAVRVHLVVLAEEGDAAAALLDDMQRLREVPSSTERDALTKARLGQGLFRHRGGASRTRPREGSLIWQAQVVAIVSSSGSAGSSLGLKHSTTHNQGSPLALATSPSSGI